MAIPDIRKQGSNPILRKMSERFPRRPAPFVALPFALLLSSPGPTFTAEGAELPPPLDGGATTLPSPLLEQRARDLDSGGLERMPPEGVDVARDSTRSESSSQGEDGILDSTSVQTSSRVVVRGIRPPLQSSRLAMKRVTDVPSLAGEPDIVRALMRSPSVAGNSDWSNKLHVRGSAADQNLVLFDDAILWSPSHFGGMMSTFVVDGLGDVVFQPGGFEARQGNRLASVLDVRTKGPGEIRDTCCVDGMFRWSNFAFSLEMERRFGPWWVVGAGRYTYFDRMFAALRDLGWSDLQLDYRFHDVQAGTGWSDGTDTLRAGWYSGRDVMDMDPVFIDWGNYAVPVQWSKELTPELRWRGSGSWSWFDQAYRVSDLSTQGNSIEAFRTRQELVSDPSPRHQVTLGYEGSFLRSRLTHHEHIAEVVNSVRTEAWIHEGYLQDRWNFAKRWILSGGVRAGGEMEMGELALDPRLTLAWTPSSRWRWEAHAGTYTQYLTSLRFDESEQPNEFWIPLLPPSVASRQILLALSAERSRLPGQLRLRGDVYTKQIRDLPWFYPNHSGREDSSIGGEWFNRKFERLHGWSAGAEATLSRDGRTWDAALSYAWGMSVLQQPDFTTEGRTTRFDPRWAPWDQRHRIKAHGSVVWWGHEEGLWPTTRKVRLRSTANLAWTTGMARTDMVGWVPAVAPGQGSDGAGAWNSDQSWMVSGNPMQGRKPDYFRLDLVPLDFRSGPDRWIWSMLNVTDHSNPIMEVWDGTATPPQSTRVEGYPFFPVMFSYEREF